MLGFDSSNVLLLSTDINVTVFAPFVNFNSKLFDFNLCLYLDLSTFIIMISFGSNEAPPKVKLVVSLP
jgi:hypothetical protein